MAEVSQMKTCPECGTSFKAVQARNGRTPEFCSRPCYMRAWARNRETWRQETASGERVQHPTEAPTCPKCGEAKTWEKDSSAKHGYRWKCVPCRNKESNAYYEANRESLLEQSRENYEPEEERRDALWRKYRLTPEQYDDLVERQDGRCAICHAQESGSRWGDGVWFVDHCHSTGEVRGLLCRSCNTALGLFEDDALRLQKAIRYLNGGNRDLVSAVLHGSNAGVEHGGVSNAGSNAAVGVSAERA